MTATPPGRPTTLEEVAKRMDRVFTDESLDAGLAFEPHPSDVIISPHAKCGTTWLQQIVHTLRTGGDMDFGDISEVVPWIETALSLDLDLDADQRGVPRAYKSHLPWEMVPKGCRYIVSFRDPRDAVVSFYRFMEGWTHEPGSIPLEEIVRARLLDRGDSQDRDYWTHFIGWWSQRDNPEVLLLTFESLKQDLPGVVKKVATFLGIDADESLLELTVRQASFDFMANNRDRFDDSMMRGLMERVADIPLGGDSAKVRVGDVGSHRVELSDELRAEIDEMWAATVGEACGLESYSAVVETLR